MRNARSPFEKGEAVYALAEEVNLVWHKEW